MKETVWIKTIEVKGLFERFNYNINLENGENISILIAPNGCGKTTIFNIIDYIFHPTCENYLKINKVPFDSFNCMLSNGKTVSLLSKSKKKSNRSFAENDDSEKLNPERQLFLSVDGEKVTPFSLDFDYEYYAKRRMLRDDEYWMNRERLRVIERIKEEKESADVRKALSKRNCLIDINYISADRLHFVFSDEDYYRTRHWTKKGFNNPIQQAQEETRKLYEEIIDEYNKLQSDAKDTLARKYLAEQKSMSFNTFKEKWTEYVNNIEKYHEIGLLGSADTILDLSSLEENFNNEKRFLSVYLSEFSKTLAPLKKNYDKMKLFVDILNERNRITYKTISYGKNGFILKVDGKELSLDCLSSGEKNDFLMFYNLIFKTPKGAVVLIDEPEISLHIEWQETFMGSLMQICEMNDSQAIVATHSPSIINGHCEFFPARGLSCE